MATTYEKIATTTITSSTASITFSSIAGTYTDLRLVLLNKSVTGNNLAYVQLNSDSGTNYSSTYLYGDGSTAVSGRATSATYISPASSGSNVDFPQLWTIDFLSYSGSTFKTALATSTNDRNGSGYTEQTVYLWRNTSAITSIFINTIVNNFGTGTTATLYGILKA
jgi:hypothetical protein